MAASLIFGAPRSKACAVLRLHGELARYLAMGLVALVGTAAATWLVLPPPPPEVEPPPPPRLELAGQALSLDGDPVADAFDLVRRYAQSEITVKLPDGSSRKLTPAVLGAEIDRVHLSELVRASLTPTSALARAYERRRQDDGDAVLSLPVPVRIDAERAVRALVAIKDEIDKAPADAVVDLDKRKVVPERIGYRLDVYGTLARLDAAVGRGAVEVEAAVDRISPRVLASQLGEVRFDHVLGWFETRYSKSSRYAARTYNLRLAASKLDGSVIFPGETFDFNDTVGPRDEANGYRVAPVIAQGEMVDGIGGGTCQISGTLHGAAFFAGLEIVERVPHSRPSGYIKLGLDAAVAYPTVNFRLANRFDFPVVLHQTVKDGVVRAEILGPARELTVSFFRRIDSVIPFEEEVRQSEDLPEGERVLTQRGIPGFKTTVFRVVQGGAYVQRRKLSTEYPPTAQIVWEGTGNGKRRLAEDSTPEYVADEYLVMTQGPGAGKPGGEMFEDRHPGKTGRRGWQKEAGMKVFESESDEDDEDGREG
jgi:vancomycin resistance protein YoaR